MKQIKGHRNFESSVPFFTMADIIWHELLRIYIMMYYFLPMMVLFKIHCDFSFCEGDDTVIF